MLYMPLDDIRSTYTQTLASSKTCRHMYRLLWPRNIEISPIGVDSEPLTQEPRSTLAETIFYTNTNGTMDPLIHSDRVLTDMIVLTLKRSTHACMFTRPSARPCPYLFHDIPSPVIFLVGPPHPL